MITSTYGIKLPENGDKGAPVFSALNSNAQIFIDHTHDGTDSAQVDQMDISRQAQNLSASWTTVSNGFKQTVTCPGAVTLDKVGLRFRIRTGGLQHTFINPTVIALSLTQFEVYVNDSTLSLECLYI